VLHHFLHHLKEVLASMMAKVIVKVCNEDVSGTFLYAWKSEENSLWSSKRETDRKRERDR
jgi:hypothetical protein